MKPSHILLYISVIFALLFCISEFFPKEGIQIGDFKIKGFNLENSKTPPPPDVDSVLLAIENSAKKYNIHSLPDSINYYKNFFNESPARLHFPNNDTTFLDQLFNQLDVAQKRKQIVRIIHYGDSQIEMDRISGYLRDQLQETFGGSGVGLVPLQQDVASYSVKQSVTGNLQVYGVYGDFSRTKEQDYGVMTKYFRITGNTVFNASKANYPNTYSRSKQYSKIKLLLNNKASEFTATLSCNSNSDCNTKSLNSDSTSLLEIMNWNLDAPVSSVNLAMKGNANIYGVILDGDYGVAVDNIPLRGCSGTIFSKIDMGLLKQTFRQLNAGLIILQFGGNAMPALSGSKSIENYAQSIAQQIKYLQAASPNSKILFIGPSDMSTRVNGNLQSYPYLSAANDALKKVVLENNAAYWDMFNVMGGENSMIAWVNHKPALAGSDYVHFTPLGAEKIASILYTSLHTYYGFYKLRQKIEKPILTKLWERKV